MKLASFFENVEVIILWFSKRSFVWNTVGNPVRVLLILVVRDLNLFKDRNTTKNVQIYDLSFFV